MIKVTYLHWNNRQTVEAWINPELLIFMRLQTLPARETIPEKIVTALHFNGYDISVMETPEEINALIKEAKTALD